MIPINLENEEKLLISKNTFLFWTTLHDTLLIMFLLCSDKTSQLTFRPIYLLFCQPFRSWIPKINLRYKIFYWQTSGYHISRIILYIYIFYIYLNWILKLKSFSIISLNCLTWLRLKTLHLELTAQNPLKWTNKYRIKFNFYTRLKNSRQQIRSKIYWH